MGKAATHRLKLDCEVLCFLRDKLEDARSLASHLRTCEEQNIAALRRLSYHLPRRRRLTDTVSRQHDNIVHLIRHRSPLAAEARILGGRE